MGCYSIDDILACAKSPMIRLIAKVSYDTRNLAKAEGFYWEPASKTWYKDIKAYRIDEDVINKYPFKVTRCEHGGV